MRIRTVKPEFFQHEGLSDLEAESGLPVRLAFMGLWCAADREGRFKWRPRRLKLHILPWDDCSMERVLEALLVGGYVARYIVDGKEYGYIPSFHEHQRPNTRESESTLPEPTEDNTCTAMHVKGTAMHVQDNGEGEGEREVEGKGKEGEGDIVQDDERHARSSVPYSDIVSLYHELLPTLPSVRMMTDSRKQAIRNRWRQFEKHSQGAMHAFEVLFHKAAASDFLVNKWGKCNFDWLMKQSNFLKVCEGNYDNK